MTGSNAVLAYRLRPTYRPARSTPERPGIDLYRAADRPAPAAPARDRARPGRTDLRHHRVGRLAYLAAVHQPGPVPPEGPAVPPRHLVLRVHLPVPAAGAELPVRGRPAVAGGRGDGARPVRRAGLAGQAPQGHRRRTSPPVHPGRHLRPAEGRGVLGGPVGHRLLPARRRDHRCVLHRRQRRAAGQDDARRDRGPVCPAVLRRCHPAQQHAARGRVRPAGAVRHPRRRALPGDHPAVRGEAERTGQGDPVHQAREIAWHPAGLRGRRGEGDPATAASPPNRRPRWPARPRRCPGCG